MTELPETVPLIVHQLADGRFFITDTTIREMDGLDALIKRMSNYWTRHEHLDGWVAPAPDGL